LTGQNLQGGSKKSKLLTQYNSLLFLSHPVYPPKMNSWLRPWSMYFGDRHENVSIRSAYLTIYGLAVTFNFNI